MRFALHQLRLFFIALQFFARCPVPRWVGFQPVWLQQCARWFSLVGALVGLFTGLVLWAALWVFPSTVAVGLSLAAGIWLTGGFHEDGWADSCDGLGGAVSRERALAIMKDSRIGSYGALGLILMLGLKAAALVALADTAPLLAVLALLWGHTVSRAAPVWLMHQLRYAGDAEHAKAKPLATEADGGTVAVAVGTAAATTVMVRAGPDMPSCRAMVQASSGITTSFSPIASAWVSRGRASRCRSRPAPTTSRPVPSAARPRMSI